MAVAFFVVILAVVLAIAAIAVGRAARLLAESEPSALFEFDEAVEYVATALPEHLSARLSYGDVRTVIAAHLSYVEQLGVEDEELVMIDDRVIDAVAGRPDVAARSVSAAEVAAILDAEADYLDAIGAVGDKAEPPEPGQR